MMANLITVVKRTELPGRNRSIKQQIDNENHKRLKIVKIENRKIENRRKTLWQR